MDKVTCALCERKVSYTILHHLIPKEEGGKYSDTIPLCQPCHITLHCTYSNKELANLYNNIPKLQAAEGLQKYLKWIRNKPIERLTNRRKKR